MKKRVALIVTMMLICVGAIAQEKYVTDIKIQTYERWWGLKLSEEFGQPFEGSFTIDTSEDDRHSYVTNAMYSNRGRFIFSEAPMKVTFDGNRLQITSAKEKVEAVRGGSSLREAYLVCRHKYARIAEQKFTGDLFAMPLYELKDKLIHSQQSVLDFVSMVESRKFPKGYVIVPDGWRGVGTEADFSTELYPDARQMVDELHAKGFKVMLTVSPYVPATGVRYLEKKRDGQLILNDEGKPAVMERERGYYACMKMTDESVESINVSLNVLKEKYGIDGFYVDFREACDLFDNMPSLKYEYVEMWNKACAGIDGVVMNYSEKMDGSFVYGFDMSRHADWDGLAHAVTMALKSSMFGYSHFAYTPLLTGDDAVTVRAVQLALSMPVAVVPSAAWELKNANVMKSMLDWRASIAEYMVSTVQSANVTDEPLIRSMEYQFGGSGFYTCMDQYMLGPKYLIAPVLEAGSSRMVRLPRGTWKSSTGERYRGPRIVNVNVANGGVAIFELQ